MALTSTRKASLLDRPFVLAPERYDPRREFATSEDAVPLGDVAMSVRKTVEPSDKPGPCLVFDTSDAREGLIISRKEPVTNIGSTKKRFQEGDVIISRLRPYLRQVAYVDDLIPVARGAELLCSTEFFVLRSNDGQSIAFLVPFLLSARVQSVLAASQEGGHHPRVRESTLLTLPVPVSLFQARAEISAAVESAVRVFRQSENEFRALIGNAEAALGHWRTDCPATNP